LLNENIVVSLSRFFTLRFIKENCHRMRTRTVFVDSQGKWPLSGQFSQVNLPPKFSRLIITPGCTKTAKCSIIGSSFHDKEVEPVARRRFLVRDIAEILGHWQAGRSICVISRSLGVCRATVRKYVYAAEARGYHQGDPTP
jgi:hypothetical protein